MKRQKNLAIRGLAGALIALLVTVGAGCGQSGTPKSKPSSSAAPTISLPPPPAGQINSVDAMFRVDIPPGYLDALNLVKKSGIPDAMVVLAMSSNRAVEQTVPNVVIDRAKVITDPQVVKDTVKRDPSYPGMKEFKVLDPPKVEGTNTLYLTWEFSHKGKPFKAFVCFVSANNRSYAVKQELPLKALSAIKPVVSEVVASWKWLPPAKKS